MLLPGGFQAADGVRKQGGGKGCAVAPVTHTPHRVGVNSLKGIGNSEIIKKWQVLGIDCLCF